MNNGIFGEGFPYSNFHDLNMDWIIKIAKDFLDQYTNIQNTILEGLEELNNTAERLNNLLQEWYDTHSEDIANQLASALADLNSWYNTHQNYLDQTLAQNILVFNQQAEQKANEVIASIPSDYTSLSNKVTKLENGLNNNDNNLYNLSFKGISEFTPKWTANEYNANGELIPSNTYYCTDKFDITDITGIVVTAPSTQRLYIYRWFLDGSFDRYISVLSGESVTISYDPLVYGKVAFETTNTQWQNVSFNGIRKLALLSDLDAENTIPAYYKAHMITKIAGIESRLFSSANTDAFIFITDVHLPDNNMISPKLINNIFRNTTVDKMICGGDIPGLYGDSDTILGNANQYYDTFYKMCIRNRRKHYMVRGNHDWTVRTSSGSATGFTAPEAEVYSLSTRLQQDDVSIPNIRNYYSFKNTTQKIKYIVLDTSEILKSNDDTVALNYAYGCHQPQINWFINELLNVETDYAVMVIGHVPVDVTLSYEGTRNLQIISDIMKAYKNKRVFNGSVDPETGNPYRIYYNGAVQETLSGNADFTSANGDLVAYMCGHEHKDEHSTIDGVNYIVVGPDALYSDDPNVTRESGTVSESLFNVCVINKTTKYIHCIRIGAGESLSLSY